jgi:hypothetical protein
MMRFLPVIATPPTTLQICPVNAHDATGSRQGGVMATYFIFGAVGQCPACADHRFSGPATRCVSGG